MVLIVGLGNPDGKYDHTPHNAGFMLVDKLRGLLRNDNSYSVSEWKKDDLFSAYIASVKKDGEFLALLAKPTTYMNKSGESVKKLVSKYNIAIVEDFILAHDDLDIELGRFKIQKNKSPKGHNGILSVESHIGTKDFWRVRIGVEGRSGEYKIPGDRYVLSPLKGDQLLLLEETLHDTLLEIKERISL